MIPPAAEDGRAPRTHNTSPKHSLASESRIVTLAGAEHRDASAPHVKTPRP